jgi:hypothetical protein
MRSGLFCEVLVDNGEWNFKEKKVFAMCDFMGADWAQIFGVIV